MSRSLATSIVLFFGKSRLLRQCWSGGRPRSFRKDKTAGAGHLEHVFLTAMDDDDPPAILEQFLGVNSGDNAWLLLWVLRPVRHAETFGVVFNTLSNVVMAWGRYGQGWLPGLSA